MSKRILALLCSLLLVVASIPFASLTVAAADSSGRTVLW
ncbi:hypothetical protein FHS17_001976 [Paenibacillus lupini]|nr:hypothetical protein [Paenibacillus lupini]